MTINVHVEPILIIRYIKLCGEEGSSEGTSRLSAITNNYLDSLQTVQTSEYIHFAY